MIDGGTCRRPGPSLMEMERLRGVGSTSIEMLSPGRTRVVMMINVKEV